MNMLISIPSIAVAEPMADGSRSADPIYAAINDYKRAVIARDKALRATWGGGGEQLIGLTKDAPESVAAEVAHREAFEHEWGLFHALFTTTPTTIAGAAALLDHMAIDPYEESEGPSENSESILEMFTAQAGRKAIITFLIPLAAALRRLDQTAER